MSSLVIIAISILLMRIAISAAYRVGLVDHPGTRKRHAVPVPLSGGIAIFATICFGVFALDIETFTDASLVIAGILLLVGVYDDYRHINPWVRLAIQYAAGILLATYGGIAIKNVGNLLAMGDIPLLLLTVPLTALSVAGLSNAYNMIDGIDGLAASLLTLPLIVLYVLGKTAAHPQSEMLLLPILPLLVFLIFNLGPDNRWFPKLFLGDAGSVTIGFLVTAALVFFSQGDNALILPVTALWLVTVPLMDMLATMLRRARKRVPLMEADRLHFHHTLMDTLGLSARQALLTMMTYAGAAAALGLVLESIPEYLSLACYFLLFFCHCTFVLKAGSRVRPLKSGTESCVME